jgi:hypothetical protein
MLKWTTAMTLAGALVLQAALPTAAFADKKKNAAVGAVIGLAVGVAIASKLKDKKHREARWYQPYSPKPGVVCYPKIAECYKRGNYSAGWTNAEFGYY